MRARLPLAFAFAALLGCLLAGCASKPIVRTQYHRPTVDSIAQNQSVSRYVKQRGDSLVRSGVFKDRKDAQAQARVEADRIYGPPVPLSSTSMFWGRPAKRDLTTSEMNEALGREPR